MKQGNALGWFLREARRFRWRHTSSEPLLQRDLQGPLGALFDHPRLAVAIVRRNCDLLAINQAWLRLFEHPHAKVLPWTEQVKLETEKELDGASVCFVSIRNADGTAKAALMDVVPIEALDAALLTFQDITHWIGLERKLRDLTGRILAAQDQERRRIALELHDGTSQLLTGLLLHLASLQQLMRENDRRDLVADCSHLAAEVARQMQAMSAVLYPPMLDEMGLTSAIWWFVDGFSKRSGIAVQVDVQPLQIALSKDAELTLFRALQESLANVWRHSHSATAQVRLEQMPERVILEVTDQGTGIARPLQYDEKSGEQPGVGIQGMRERLRQLGGDLFVSSRPGCTTIRAEVPARSPYA